MRCLTNSQFSQNVLMPIEVDTPHIQSICEPNEDQWWLRRGLIDSDCP